MRQERRRALLNVKKSTNKGIIHLVHRLQGLSMIVELVSVVLDLICSCHKSLAVSSRVIPV